MGEKWIKPGKQKFAARLGENIKKYSKLLLKPGGNIVMAKINYDFALELIEIFNETLVEMLLAEGKVNFDQFGKYEIKTCGAKRINNQFTNNQDYIIPPYQAIRFCPAARLKLRIKGEVVGKVKKNFYYRREEQDGD